MLKVSAAVIEHFEKQCPGIAARIEGLREPCIRRARIVARAIPRLCLGVSLATRSIWRLLPLE